MIIFVHITWKFKSATSLGPIWAYTGTGFNTDTLAMQPVSGERQLGVIDPQPSDVYLQDGDLIYYTCSGTTATRYLYVRATESFTVDTLKDAPYCGYTPPPVTSCTLLIASVSVVDDTATVSCTNYVGPLRYSLDGGVTQQAEPVLKQLSPGKYKLTVYDLGATQAGCHKTFEFEVAAQAATGQLPKVAALPVFCFAGNPVPVQVQAGAPFRNVIVQVYVETEFRSGSFMLAYESQRRSSGQREVIVDVHDILSAHVINELTLGDGWRYLTKPARNWFVRVADVLPQTGKPGTWVTSTNSVVLHGGLAPEPLLAGADYWTTARPARLLHTWQPLHKKVGPEHLEVLQLLVPDNAQWYLRITSYNETGQAQAATRDRIQPPRTPAPVAANAVQPPPVLDAQLVSFVQLQLPLVLLASASQHMLEIVNATDQVLAYPRVLEVASDTEPRQLIYENSIGGHDTLALFGKMTGKLLLDGQVVDAYLDNSARQTLDRLSKSWPGTPTGKNYTLSTGWLSPDWLEYLHELVQPGRQVYEYGNGQLRPVVITNKELPTYQEAEGLQAAVIEYKAALTNEYFTDYARNTNRNASVGFGW